MIRSLTNKLRSEKLDRSNTPAFNDDSILPPQHSSRGLIVQPSPSNRSVGCQDDPTYRFPVFDFQCSLLQIISCQNLGSIGFTPPQIQELALRCPKSCNTCEVERPSVSPSSKPSAPQSYTSTFVPTATVSIAPTSCQDDTSFREKCDFYCFLYSDVTFDGFLSANDFFSEEVITNLSSCEKRCGYCPKF